MTNSFTSLIRDASRAVSRSLGRSGISDDCKQAPMTVLSFEQLKHVRGGDGVIESPKGSWGPMIATSAT